MFEAYKYVSFHFILLLLPRIFKFYKGLFYKLTPTSFRQTHANLTKESHHLPRATFPQVTSYCSVFNCFYSRRKLFPFVAFLREKKPHREQNRENFQGREHNGTAEVERSLLSRVSREVIVVQEIILNSEQR